VGVGDRPSTLCLILHLSINYTLDIKPLDLIEYNEDKKKLGLLLDIGIILVENINCDLSKWVLFIY